MGVKLFKDEAIHAPFNELPVQLRPNQTGLTGAQFQVYKDFNKLNELLSPGELPDRPEKIHPLIE